MSEVDKQISERIAAIFPSREIASKIVDLVVTKRPVGVSKLSYYSYYREYYALLYKPSIDEMIKTKQTIIFRYDIFCPEVSEQTLYNKVNQGIRYLIDNLDPDRTYHQWRDIVTITRSKSRGGVVIEFIAEVRRANQANMSGELVYPKEDTTPKWRLDMDMWLESVSTKPFIRENMTLSLKEVEELKLELKELKGIMFDVKPVSIKIMRVNI